MVVVQVVRWSWSKLSRDVVGGRIRARLPRAYRLSGQQDSLVAEHQGCPAAEDYRPTFTVERHETVPGRVGLLRLRACGLLRYQVGIAPTLPGGQPERAAMVLRTHDQPDLRRSGRRGLLRRPRAAPPTSAASRCMRVWTSSRINARSSSGSAAT
jgi:hypothetical protein